MPKSMTMLPCVSSRSNLVEQKISYEMTYSYEIMIKKQFPLNFRKAGLV